MSQERLFDQVSGAPDLDRVAFMRRVATFIAPGVTDGGSVTKDPVSFDVAEAISRAFGELDAENGLTREQLAVACSEICDPDTFANRFEVFLQHGMLRRRLDKPNQRRYVLDPTSTASLLVFDRLARDGGVQEIVALLDRVRTGLRAGTVDRHQAEKGLVQVRCAFANYANHLRRLQDKPLEESIAERRHHRNTTALLSDARDTIVVVSEHFPDLTAEAQRLLREAQRYSAAVGAFMDRLLADASTKRDFSMLDPEQYLTAARGAPRDQLAKVFARTVFDPPSLAVTPDGIITAIEAFRPRTARRRPPRPADPLPGADPVEQARARAQQTRERRLRTAELLLQGGDEVDLTSSLQALTWPGAAVRVTALVAVDGDEQLPYEVEFRDAVLVDAEAPTTHVTRTLLRRRPADRIPAQHAAPEQESQPS